MSGTRFWRLDGGGATLAFASTDAGMPILLHWGAGLAAQADLPCLLAAVTPQRLNAAPDQPVPLSMLPQHGFGFLGAPAILGSREGRDFATDFRLVGVDARGSSLCFHAADEVTALALTIELDLDPDTGVLRCRRELRNLGPSYELGWLAALAIELPASCGEALTSTGRWGREHHPTRLNLVPGIVERISRGGRTGHAGTPTVAIGEPGFSELDGRVMALHLGWSGNHRLLVETLPDGTRQAQLGEWLAPGEIRLAEGGAYRTPWAFGAWSTTGLNGLSHAFHDHLRRTHLPRRLYAKPRPVHLNSWEAVYFRHEGADLLDMAEVAASLGVERFVLDDGWFGRRDDDRTSLGDWKVDGRKYPDGLGPLVDGVRQRGLEFGLWVEPEMISPDSDLYRSHPDWCLHIDQRTRPLGRHQLVLDVTREEVARHIYGRLDRLLRGHAISYLKWDHNRDLYPAASGGRPAAHRQTLAVYALLDRLREAHPEVEIESCAGGGGRIDLGIMARADRFWASDQNDALERQAIQRGISLLFPLEVIGAHVGPSPCHTTHRRLSLQFRARTAMFGHMGLELDPRGLDDGERRELARHIACYKRFRHLLHGGRLWRFGLGDPGGLGQIAVAPDGSEALAQLVRLDLAPTALAAPARLPGLLPDVDYRLTLVEPWPELAAGWLADAGFWRAGPILDGRSLQTVGFRLPLSLPETAWLVHLERV